MKRFSGVSALALYAFTSPALADVTPQQVWDDLETYMQGFGYSVTATETQDGNNLNVTDVVLAMPVPDMEGEVSFSVESIVLTDQGDGTVKMAFPAEMPVRISGIDEGESFDVTLLFGQEGMDLTISGEPDNLVYDYSAARMTMSLSKLMAEGAEITRDMLRIDVATGPIAGKSEVSRADGVQTVTQDLDYGNLTFDVAFNDPDSGEAGLLNGTLSGVSAGGTSTMPENVNYADTEALMDSGFGVAATIGVTGSQVEFAVTEEQGTTSGKFDTGAGELVFDMSKTTLSYSEKAVDVAFSISGPEIPVPFSASIADTAFKLEMPLTPADAPQNGTFELVLGGFEMAELLWNMFDPGSNLPRDPATIRIAMDAKLSPLVNIFNSEEMAGFENSDAPPAELNALTVRELVLDAVGANINGTGDFTFDNSDLESFDGMPRPEGTLNLSMSGINGLIDKLIEMGMVSEEDAMGGRMMLGMFTVPGDAPDTASSVIVVNEEGHVLANGQRLK